MELSQKQKNNIAKNIDEKLQSFWKGWHIVRHIGTGAYSEVYEVHRVYFNEDTHSALKIVRLDQNGVPIRCKTDAWNSVFYSPEDEPTASLLVPSSNSSSGSRSSVPSGNASRSGKSASGSASGSKGASFSYSHSSNSAGDPGSFESSSHSMGFIEEINIMRSLHGAPNVVSIEDYFLQPVDDGVIVYIRMELLECLSDSRIFNSPDDVPVRDVRKLGMDICRALIYCEKVNVIHRDIKPGNIFINKFGDYLIGDFGISRPLDSFSGSDSTQGTGTISYMAPEIYSRLDYGSTIDIYSLGIVLYQMLNKGRVPFLPMPPINYTKEDLNKANGRRFRGEPLPLIASVDKGLQDIVRKACAFRPENRYASAQDFYEALSRYQFPEERSELFSSFEEEDTVNIRETSRPGKSSGLFFDDFPDDEFSPGFLSQKDREDLSRDFPMQEDHGTSRSFPSQTGKEPSRDYPSQKDRKSEVPAGNLFEDFSAASSNGQEAESFSASFPSPEDTDGSSAASSRKSRGGSSASSSRKGRGGSSASSSRKGRGGSSAASSRKGKGGSSAASSSQNSKGGSSAVSSSQNGRGGSSAASSFGKDTKSSSAASSFSKDTESSSAASPSWKETDSASAASSFRKDTDSSFKTAPEAGAGKGYEKGQQERTDKVHPWKKVAAGLVVVCACLAAFLLLRDNSWKPGKDAARSMAASSLSISDTAAESSLPAIVKLVQKEEEAIENLPLTIDDPSLKHSILAALDISGDQLLLKDTYGVTELALRLADQDKEKGIKSLAGLALFPSLQNVSLANCNLGDDVDFSALQNLPDLQILNLHGNQISSAEPFRNLTGMQWLDLGDNKLSDISPLAGMTGLQSLSLHGNEITDISALTNMTGLVNLYLDDNKITSLAPLKDMKSLQVLGLQKNEITDLSPLQGLPALQSLVLSSNKIADISALSSLTGLRELWINNNQISDVSPISSLSQLTWLDLGGNKFSDVSPLQGMTGLAGISLSKNSIEDITPLQKLTRLTYLDLEGNKIKVLSPLEKLASLETLYLNDNRIEDPSPLKNLKKLNELALGKNKIKDLSSLQDLTQLQSLDLYTNEISDISVLAQLKKLTWLNIGRNQISSLAPISDLTNLESLQIYRNSISDLSPLAGLTALKYLVADVNSISSLQPLQNLTNMEVLYAEYNNIQDVYPLSNLTQLKEVYLAGNPIGDYSPLENLPGVKIYKESK